MIAIVCPGQGSQTPGMLSPWLDVSGSRSLLAQLSQAADLDLASHGTTSDDETIKDTAVAQPLLVASGLIAWSALTMGGARPGEAVVAGHSVGEITATAITGVLDPAEAMGLVARRGRAMAQAAAATPTGMSAVLGGDPDEVLAALQALGLTPANVNGAGQIVAAGTHEQLADLSAAPPSRTRVIPLKVAGAFHTAHMSSATAALRGAAQALIPSNPTYTLLSNSDGGVVGQGVEALNRVVTQVSNPVRWDRCMDTMATLGVRAMIELLPGGTLTGLAKRALKGVECVAIKTPDDLEAARDLMTRHAGPTGRDTTTA